MRLPPFDIMVPKTKRDVLSVLDRYGKEAKIIAGGTELTSLLKLGLAAPRYLISLKSVGSLSGIKATKEEVVIKSLTTIRELAHAPLINDKFKSIAQAARLVAAPPIQNAATVGGNILQNTRCIYRNQSALFHTGLQACYKSGGKTCHAAKGASRCFSVYQGDIVPPLVSFRSRVKLEKKGSHRIVSMADLFSGRGENPFSIEENELLTEIIVPLPAGKYGSAYEKLRIRQGLEYPLVSVAGSIFVSESGRNGNVHLVIGAAGSGPKAVSDELRFSGDGGLPISDIRQIADNAASAAEIVDNLSLPPGYRRKMVKVLAKRAIQNSFHDMQGGGR